MLPLKSFAIASMVAALATLAHPRAGLADQHEDEQYDPSVYSRAAIGSFRGAQDPNRWQLESGVFSNESLIDQRSGGEEWEDSYTGLRWKLPFGQR